jgi:hypothetical protein
MFKISAISVSITLSVLTLIGLLFSNTILGAFGYTVTPLKTIARLENTRADLDRTIARLQKAQTIVDGMKPDKRTKKG